MRREIIRNCRVEADRDGSHAALIQDLNPGLESVAILLKCGWRDGDKVRIVVTLRDAAKEAALKAGK